MSLPIKINVGQSPDRTNSVSSNNDPTSPGTPLSPGSLEQNGFMMASRTNSPEGMDCYAEARDFLNDFERYFNNAYLSDVTLVVGDEMFFAHRLMLVKSSEVFERMLSEQWEGTTKKEIELVEDQVCVKVFPAFLRFLYCNHVNLHGDNVLPLLILADKYNVVNLRKVCLEYTVKNILPDVSLKDLFHVWFEYGTKCFHQVLINHCIRVLAACFEDIIRDSDWDKDWGELDRDQLIEFLKCNELTVPNEYELWLAIQKWIQAPNHPERRGNTAAPLLASLLPLIRFPFMTADELNNLERSPIVEQHPKLFQSHIMTAYKFQALSLQSRVGVKEFTGTQFLLRNYSDLRWDKRLCLNNMSNIPKYTEISLKFCTRASALPAQNWEWDLKVHPKGFSGNNDEFRVFLSSTVILDQSRAIEYLLQVVDDKKVVRSVAGKRTFTKTRYSADLEIEKKIGLEEILAENSPLLVNDNLNIQLTMRPID